MSGGNVTCVVANRDCIEFEQPRPGLHPFYFATAGRYIYWDEREWPLRRKLRGLGFQRVDVKQLEGGMSVRFNGHDTQTRTVAPTIPDTHYPSSVQEAQRQFASRLIYSVQDSYRAHKGGKVAVLLSGGVDSIAVAWALTQAAKPADVLCLTVGRTEDDFDPRWARAAAEYLGLPWEFVRLPSRDDELQHLLERTLVTIEQTSFSNVLMGLCCELIRDRMVARDHRIGYMGFWGDLLFGHKLQVTGSFNHLPLPEQTDQNWTKQRVLHCWHTKPHTMQLAKGLRAGGETTWRVPFLSKHVAPWAFGLPRTYAPVAMDKPLLYGMMDQYIPREVAAWHFAKKIGFYTGAGAGKIRLVNPILQDPNIRATFARLRLRHI